MSNKPSHAGVLRPMLAAAVAMAIAPAVPAAIIVLNPGNNIQAAINGAVDGDEIVLNPGLYEQVFEITGKRLTIRASDPEDPGVVAATIVDGVGLGSVIRVAATGSGPTVIDGLTITGGNAATGGGIYVESAVEVVVTNCMIEANTASNPGGGLRATQTAMTIQDCTFRDNMAIAAGGDGGGMYIDNQVVTVERCLFENNFADDTGGGARFDSATAQVTDCVFDGNSVGGDGGAIFIRSGTDLFVDSSEFRNNAAANGGAMHVWSDSGTFARIRNSEFQGNTASAGAGAGAPRGVDDPDSVDLGESLIGPMVDMGALEFQPAQPPASCPGDIDGDGTVGINDFLGLLAAWGPCP